MFIAKGELEYGWKKKLLELFDKEPVAYRRLRERVKMYDLPHTREELDKLNEYTDRKLDTIDDLELEAWTSVGIEVKMSRVRGLRSNDPDIHKTIYQISVANVGLMQIQRVEVLEDCCTDHLQRELDRGWRILAVCPPNDARRPSYVVGHMEKEA